MFLKRLIVTCVLFFSPITILTNSSDFVWWMFGTFRPLLPHEFVHLDSFKYINHINIYVNSVRHFCISLHLRNVECKWRPVFFMNCVVIRNIFKILLLPITETSNHVIRYIRATAHRGRNAMGDETIYRGRNDQGNRYIKHWLIQSTMPIGWFGENDNKTAIVY
jgi:hypothetical protein